jgi:hypothetical protein
MKNKKKIELHYAEKHLKELIKNNRFYTILEYILEVWKHKPRIKKIDIANIVTMDYLNQQTKEGKDNENNIKFINFKLN